MRRPAPSLIIYNSRKQEEVENISKKLEQKSNFREEKADFFQKMVGKGAKREGMGR